MKKFKIIFITILIFSLCSILLFTSCKEDKCQHEFGQWETIIEATCQNKGLKNRVCSICQETENCSIEKSNHTLTFVDSKSSTCAEHGNIEFYHCEVCDGNFADENASEVINDVSLPLLNHTFGKWIITDSPTDEVVKKEHTCSICNYKEEFVIEPSSDYENKSSVYYYEITKLLELTKDYEGKNFLIDGIGTATVYDYIDGDSTRFTTTQGDTVIIRYCCVDTPENTGEPEKWGKSAFNFVKSRLSEASEIVLESSTGGKPDRDAYGSRYLGFVWYKTADYDEFRLLNLELVENGYSDNFNLNFPYAEFFSQANSFAKYNHIRVYGNDDDPLYSTDPIPMTLKDFWENYELYYNEESDSGAKVVFTAYLERLYVLQSGMHTFTGATYDPETREKYSISIYVGYSSNPASKLKIGNLYTFVGVVQKHNGNFQILGINYNPIFETELKDGTYTVQEKYYMTFDSSEVFVSQYSETLYSDITVKTATVENGILTIVGNSKQKLVGDELSDVTEEFTLTVKVDDNYVNKFVAGDVIRLRGYQLESDSHEILVSHISDIIKN